MFKCLRHTLSVAVFGGLLITSTTASADNKPVYKVTITNITHSISFTPILVASHRKGVSLYKLGAAASDELSAVAEAGDTGPLAAQLQNNRRVADVQSSDGLLAPGDSVTVSVAAKKGARHISLASMMLPTNDGFIALNAVKAPQHGSVSYYSSAFDAGSEPNDELCISIPGPICGGGGPSPEAGGEGYVHIHRGMHGIGDLAPDVYDWRNPVAKITITRKHDH